MAKKVDIVYKLTTQDNKTRKGSYNECTWGPGVTHKGTGKGALCGPGFIHAYLSPELAALLNPSHANIKNPKLWRCETTIVKTDNGLKVGGVSLTSLSEMSLPVCSNEQRVIFAILCGQAVFGGKSAKWDKWAQDYLDGLNRSDAAARTARAAANDARAAAYAADAAANDARAAAYAADAAAYVVAARTARAAADAKVFDLAAIAKEALTYV